MQPGAIKLAPRLLEEMLAAKEKLKAKLEAELTEKEIREALRDSHAHRRPIPCGMTIHTGIGCSLGCLYCYVPDMGFPMKPRPYPLTGAQLVYALLSNPYFLPGPHGTLLAFGSVTEPFLDETVDRALEYLEYTWKLLGNPQQISTKKPIWGEKLERFLRNSDPRISILVTITTIKHAQKLEPAAPNPLERLRWMKTLAERGRHVTLFLRPIIPGVTDRELEEIIRLAKQHGAKAVIPGSLRVTPGIAARLKASGIVDMREIERRLPRSPRDNRDQVTLRMRDLKQKAAETARRHGLKVLPSSCSANIESHMLACHACHWGPCGNPHRLPAVDEQAAKEMLELLGCKPRRVRVTHSTITATCTKPRDRRTLDRIAVLIETTAKRKTIIKPAA